jgi:hypothetical protein
MEKLQRMKELERVKELNEENELQKIEDLKTIEEMGKLDNFEAFILLGKAQKLLMYTIYDNGDALKGLRQAQAILLKTMTPDDKDRLNKVKPGMSEFIKILKAVY